MRGRRREEGTKPSSWPRSGLRRAIVAVVAIACLVALGRLLTTGSEELREAKAQFIKRRIHVKVATRAALSPDTASGKDIPSSKEQIQRSRVAQAGSLPLQTAEAYLAPEKPECAQLSGQGVDSVAVVGNGPLSLSQRRIISMHSVVVRFNFLNNMWRKSERIDIWVVRYSFEANHRFWGFGQMPLKEAKAVLSKTKSLWLVANQENAWAMEDLIANVPEAERHSPVLIDQDKFAAMSTAQSHMLSNITEAPSTGFIGLMTVLACIGPAVKVHIYGMNWTPKIWKGHSVEQEAAYIARLEQAGRVQVHKPPCDGMRSCDEEELDSDCHYDLRHRFVCPIATSSRAAGPSSAKQEEREFASVQEVISRAFRQHSSYLGNLAASA